jgi:hypothetical protein
MDSRSLKDSNDILFANFGCRDQKIWFLQDWIEFWFRFLFEICYDQRLATWSFSTGPYRFGRIGNFSRRILWCFDGPDHPETLRLSDLFRIFGFRSNGWEWIWGRLTVGGLGFRRGHRRCGQVVDLRRVLVASGRRRCYDGLQEIMESPNAWSTVSVESRRREGRRLEAVMASGDDELLVPLQNKMIPMN